VGCLQIPRMGLQVVCFEGVHMAAVHMVAVHRIMVHMATDHMAAVHMAGTHARFGNGGGEGGGLCLHRCQVDLDWGISRAVFSQSQTHMAVRVDECSPGQWIGV
jgi:hypothetical protein